MVAPWVVYIVRCLDRTYYTGITTDLVRRLAEHNSGRGAKYTRSRRPVVLAYSEPATSRSAAAKRENQIKKMSLIGKKNLIENLYALPADNVIAPAGEPGIGPRSGK